MMFSQTIAADEYVYMAFGMFGNDGWRYVQ